MKVRGVILAAGASSRMGRPKALEGVDGETMVQRAVRIVTEATNLRPVLVIGAHPQVAHSAGVAEVVINSNWQDGPGTSIRSGARVAFDDSVDAVLVMPCDLPRVTADDLRRLIAALRRPFTASAAAFDDTIGPPACLDRTWMARLLDLDPQRGMKRQLIDAGNAVAHVPLPAAALDIDTPEQLHRLRRSSSAATDRDVPDPTRP